MNEYEYKRLSAEVKEFEKEWGFKAPEWAYERLKQLKEGENDEHRDR